MPTSLKLHPDSRCDAVEALTVEVTRPRQIELELRYLVTGATADIRMPALAAPARGDQLWRHTCFEAFVRAPAAVEYYEFNFAPSKEWAAYRFTSYRNGMSPLTLLTPPRTDVLSMKAPYELQASLDLTGLPLPDDAPWLLSLAAVIEETNGRISYWSLEHPPGKPDFHHSDCFTLRLSPA